MDKSQVFYNLEVNSIKTKYLDNSYRNNILYINSINCKNITLYDSFSNYYVVTKDTNMDIQIKLDSHKIGTKFRIFITNLQNSLRISCKNVNDKFKGYLKINNNNTDINNEKLENNLKKKYICESNGDDIIYIPQHKLGLYNGGYIDLVYHGNKYCNTPENIEVGYWMTSGDIIGLINIPKSIIKTSGYLLTIYLDVTYNKIICVTTKNITTNEIFFNKINNNNIVIFLELTYTIHIINVNDNTLIYNSDSYNSNIITNAFNITIFNNNSFISLRDINDPGANQLKFISEFTEANTYNIKNTFNTNITNYNNLNIIEYNILNNSNIIINGFFNIISIEAYNNQNDINITLPNLAFDYYNVFTNKTNKILINESKY